LQSQNYELFLKTYLLLTFINISFCVYILHFIFIFPFILFFFFLLVTSKPFNSGFSSYEEDDELIAEKEKFFLTRSAGPRRSAP